MAKVYVSSTRLDLELERSKAFEWLITTHHQPFHSYIADTDTVRDSCLKDVEQCDVYLLILGQRYGFQPKESNPLNLSITHLEFRRAVELKKPIVALIRKSVPNLALTELLDPDKAKRLVDFENEVRSRCRPAEFLNEAEFVVR